MNRTHWIAGIMIAIGLAFAIGRITSPRPNHHDQPLVVPAQHLDVPIQRVAPVAADPIDDLPTESGITIRVERVEISEGYEIKGVLGSKPLSMTETCITIYFQVKNTTKIRKFDGDGKWPTAQLSDEHGNHYKILTNDSPARPTSIPQTLKPGESFRDVLVFQAPLEQAKTLTFSVQDHYRATTGPPRSSEVIKISSEIIKDPKHLVYREP